MSEMISCIDYILYCCEYGIKPVQCSIQTAKDELKKIRQQNHKMDNISNPLDSIIEFAWASGADRFWINNAKDELKRLRQEIDRLKKLFDNPIAWARINDRGDIYGLRYTNNPYIDQTTVLPLYSDREGCEALYAKKTLPSNSPKSES